MDKILKPLYSLKPEFIICGDFNTDYLPDNCRKSQFSSLLNSYNLFSIVDFPTRIQNTSKCAIDNIFIDYSRLGTFNLAPICNGISDHDSKLILILDIGLPFSPKCSWNTRKID
jgi:endonuclease/exonuclease/phosphatase family metal-dependent hydrolase